MLKKDSRVSMVLVVAVSVVILAGVLWVSPAITGFATVGSGQTTAVGVSELANPEYGIVKGAVTYVILDTDGHIAERSSPKDDLSLYLVPQGTDVDWSKEITCGPGGGTLSWVDPDDEGTVCISLNWYSTTSTCSAFNNEGQDISAYRLNVINGPGCFAARVPAGDYDLYAK